MRLGYGGAPPHWALGKDPWLENRRFWARARDEEAGSVKRRIGEIRFNVAKPFAFFVSIRD
jgi:hypothetical protein